MDETPLKRCSKCRHLKSHDAFARHARYDLQSWCRACNTRRRRARRLEATIEPFTYEDLLHRLEEVYDNRCAYCGCCISEGYHWDHVQPLSEDGAHALENLAPACPRCNLSKGPRAARAWIGPHLARLDREILGHHEDRSRGRTSESKSAWARSEAGRASGRERGRRRRQRMRGVAPSGPLADEGA